MTRIHTMNKARHRSREDRSMYRSCMSFIQIEDTIVFIDQQISTRGNEPLAPRRNHVLCLDL